MKPNFVAAVLAPLAIALAACSGPAEPPKPADDNPTGLVVTNGRMMLNPVKGNPAAVYFDVANQGTRAVAVRAADVTGAKSAMLHDMVDKGGMAEMVPLAIKPGETVKFAPGGKHVMAFDISPEIAAGGKTELTLIIAGGDKVTTEIAVEAAGAER